MYLKETRQRQGLRSPTSKLLFQSSHETDGTCWKGNRRHRLWGHLLKLRSSMNRQHQEYRTWKRASQICKENVKKARKCKENGILAKFLLHANHKDQLRVPEINGYFHYLDCGDGFMDSYICQNLCQLDLNEMVKTQTGQTIQWVRVGHQIHNNRNVKRSENIRSIEHML